MAGAEITPEPAQRICALRLPGTSRARFVDAGEVAAELGDWVTIDTGPGEEPGLIVVAPDQWIQPVSMDGVPSVLRRLGDEEIDTLAGNIERALELIPQAADIVRTHAPGSYLTGLRLTLKSDAAIVVYHGPEPAKPSVLVKELSEQVALPVSLEQDHPTDPEQALLSGSTGMPRRSGAQTFRELLEERIDVLREPGTFAPHGIPRLGSEVMTPYGSGTLVAVEIRKWRATVRVQNGEEVTLGVDELTQP